MGVAIIPPRLLFGLIKFGLVTPFPLKSLFSYCCVGLIICAGTAAGLIGAGFGGGGGGAGFGFLLNIPDIAALINADPADPMAIAAAGIIISPNCPPFFCLRVLPFIDLNFAIRSFMFRDISPGTDLPPCFL